MKCSHSEIVLAGTEAKSLNMSYGDFGDFIPFSTLTDPRQRFEIEYLLFRGTQSEVYKGIDKENGTE